MDLYHARTSREKKRKDLSLKLGREMKDRREDYSGAQQTENVSIQDLRELATHLCVRPETNEQYLLRLFPITLERSAILAQLDWEQSYAMSCTEMSFEEERERVEDEYQKGTERVRERLLESIEERRKRAREDKEGEGISGDASLDSQSRTHLTRKRRNRMGTPPAATPPPANSATLLPVTTGPFSNPYSLSVDEIPSPFPLPLTATSAGSAQNGSATGASNSNATSNSRRKPKGTNTNQEKAPGGLGKSILLLTECKEHEIEADLGEIRRGGKRRRIAAVGR